jgi:endonuclease/exonuclease/phosphatase family metal-dependent hydrolase
MTVLLTWNVLYGFHNMNNAYPEPSRLLHAMQLIKEQDPDILVMNEAAFGHHWMGNFTDYENLFEFPHFAYRPSNQEWGNAIFSKFPIKKVISKQLDVKTSIGCVLDIHGEDVLIETYHTHPYWPEEHKKEMFSQLLTKRPKNYILTGDFNIVSHRDKNPFGVSLVSCMFEDSGLIDAFGDNRETTFPTKMIKVSEKNPNVRLDHCFVSKTIKIINAAVIRHYLADLASDHYPIRIEFEIK